MRSQEASPNLCASTAAQAKADREAAEVLKQEAEAAKAEAEAARQAAEAAQAAAEAAKAEIEALLAQAEETAASVNGAPHLLCVGLACLVSLLVSGTVSLLFNRRRNGQKKAEGAGKT